MSTSDESSRLSDLEFAMIVAINGFHSWVSHCAEAAGGRGMGPLDVLVLHAINQRARNKRLADICLVLNVEDTHTVAYSLKKLEEYGYATHRQDGRDRIYQASPDGDAFCARYVEIRESNLVESLKTDELDFVRLDEATKTLNRMTRYYTHASRTATVTKRK
ncbi:MAG: transcriptional regulator [Hyphomicrobiales bacterium]|nr:MAG: transcriptional regulator [Hyphomicrobiales bacterium]